MKRTVIFAAFAALLSFFSCSKEIEMVVDPVSAGSDVVFTATLQQPTKANISSYSIEWEVGDKIAVYDGAAWRESDALAAGDIVGNVASFKFTANPPASAAEYYAVYPASAASAAPVGDAITVTLPAVQNITSGCVAKDALVQVCKADNTTNLDFVNVTSLIEFKVPEDNISSVFFEAVPDGTFALGSRLAIAGDASVSSVSPAANVAGTDNRVIVNGAFVSGENYFAVVYPASTVGKYRFTFTKIDPTDGAIKAFRTGSADNVTSLPLNGGWKFETFGLTAESWLGPLSTKSDLVKWVSACSYYQVGETVKLGANIDYEGSTWNPVDGREASDVGFKGTFDGQDYSIYNIAINADTGDNCGLFTHLTGTAKRTRVTHLKLGYDPSTGKADGTSSMATTTNSESDPRFGVIAGSINHCLISYVDNYIPITIGGDVGTLSTKNSVQFGGYVGRSGAESSFSHCNNYADISFGSTAAALYLGGFVGVTGGNNITVEYCENYGKILRTQTAGAAGNVFIGGIIGRTGKDNTNYLVDNCNNYAKVGATVDPNCLQLYIGGIVGMDNAGPSAIDLTVSNCINKDEGEIYCPAGTSGSADIGVGGILGCANSTTLIDNCKNLGPVKKAGDLGAKPQVKMGGIVGKFSGAGSTVQDCINGSSEDSSLGAVTDFGQTTTLVNQRIGGIAGIQSEGTITGCKNYGKIWEKSTTSDVYAYVGGIVGNHTIGILTNCENYGIVQADGTTEKYNAGGIIGLQSGKVAISTGTGCKVNASISSGFAYGAGLVVGSTTQTSNAAVLGADADKIKIGGGSVNGNAINDGNFASYLGGWYVKVDDVYSTITASGTAFGKTTIWAAFE